MERAPNRRSFFLWERILNPTLVVPAPEPGPRNESSELPGQFSRSRLALRLAGMTGGSSEAQYRRALLKHDIHRNGCFLQTVQIGLKLVTDDALFGDQGARALVVTIALQRQNIP